MRRVTNIYRLIQSAIQVIFFLVIGMVVDLVSLRLILVMILLFFYLENDKEDLNIEIK